VDDFQLDDDTTAAPTVWSRMAELRARVAAAAPAWQVSLAMAVLEEQVAEFEARVFDFGGVRMTGREVLSYQERRRAQGVDCSFEATVRHLVFVRRLPWPRLMRGAHLELRRQRRLRRQVPPVGRRPGRSRGARARSGATRRRACRTSRGSPGSEPEPEPPGADRDRLGAARALLDGLSPDPARWRALRYCVDANRELELRGLA